MISTLRFSVTFPRSPERRRRRSPCACFWPTPEGSRPGGPYSGKSPAGKDAFALADTTPLEYPPGSKDLYSDLGAIVLTQVLETVYHQRIDSLLQQRVFGPLGLTSLGYVPPSDWLSRIAPTEMDPWRGRVLRGEVHDENAAVMDGVSGHAGLFGSVEDLLGFAEWMLGESDGRSGGGSDKP